MKREEAAKTSRSHSQRALHVLCLDPYLESSARIFLGLQLQQKTQWEIVTLPALREEKKTKPQQFLPQSRMSKLTQAGWGGTENRSLSLLKTVLIAFSIYKGNTCST